MRQERNLTLASRNGSILFNATPFGDGDQWWVSARQGEALVCVIVEDDDSLGRAEAAACRGDLYTVGAQGSETGLSTFKVNQESAAQAA